MAHIQSIRLPRLSRASRSRLVILIDAFNVYHLPRSGSDAFMIFLSINFFLETKFARVKWRGEQGFSPFFPCVFLGIFHLIRIRLESRPSAARVWCWRGCSWSRRWSACSALAVEAGVDDAIEVEWKTNAILLWESVPFIIFLPYIRWRNPLEMVRRRSTVLSAD